MFSVVIPCYNLNEEGLQLTKNAIGTFYPLDNLEAASNVELILVDNDSKVGGGYLREQANTYVRNWKNLGYAKAVNQGIKLATNRYVAIANSDIRVSPNWQQITQEIFDQNTDIATLHFRMTDYDVPFAYGVKTAITGKERWCTGSFFVIDKEKQLLFDERFFNSYDDWDYQLRARQSGWNTAYTNRACYQHNHSFTQKLIPEREENNKRNAEYFKQKHGRYAEEIFAEQFPEQITQDYRGGFEI